MNSHEAYKIIKNIVYWGMLAFILYLGFAYLPELAGRECCPCPKFLDNATPLNISFDYAFDGNQPPATVPNGSLYIPASETH